jgi:hypothetical protein
MAEWLVRRHEADPSNSFPPIHQHRGMPPLTVTASKLPSYGLAKLGPLVQFQQVDLHTDPFSSCRNANTSPLDWITKVDNGR